MEMKFLNGSFEGSVQKGIAGFFFGKKKLLLGICGILMFNFYKSSLMLQALSAKV
eukprot:c24416_g2_i1 orf=339-503(-)